MTAHTEDDPFAAPLPTPPKSVHPHQEDPFGKPLETPPPPPHQSQESAPSSQPNPPPEESTDPPRPIEGRTPILAELTSSTQAQVDAIDSKTEELMTLLVKADGDALAEAILEVLNGQKTIIEKLDLSISMSRQIMDHLGIGVRRAA